MAWTLRWIVGRLRGAQDELEGRLVLTVGSAATEIRRVALSARDVWRLRQGSTILRDGLLVIPEGGTLQFVLARPVLANEERMLGTLDASVLG